MASVLTENFLNIKQQQGLFEMNKRIYEIIFGTFLSELHSEPVYDLNMQMSLVISHAHVAGFSEPLLEQNNAHIITLLTDNFPYILLWARKDRKGKQTGLNPVR